MNYQVNPCLWSNTLAVPSVVVDEHLRLCSGLALKVLLWILRHPADDNSPAALAEKLRQSPPDIADALNFWEEHGVLQKVGAEVLHVNAETFTASETAEAAPVPKAKPLVTRTGRPRFPRDEAIALVDSDQTLALLLDEGQTIFGKAFTSADLDSLAALYSYYGLSAHFILTAMHYCCKINKRSVGYVESVCVAWLNDGVDDENIGAYVDALERRRTNEGIIRREFGIGDRRLTAKEKSCIAVWFDEYKTPPELISLAYEKAVESTGKLSFSYIHTILTAWSKKQITTLEAALAEGTPAKKKDAKPTAADKQEMTDRLVAEFMNE